MTTTKRTWAILGAAGLAVVSTVAIAGTAVYGHGNSKADAMAQADRRVESEAASRRTCVSEYATPQTCVQNNGMWTCHAIVANHQGSCRR